MKLPKHFSKRLVFFISLAVLLISALAVYYFFLRPQVKTLDDFPIMVINDGQTAVYQEVKVTKDRLEKQIVVSNLGQDSQKEVKIYEYIPKEVAQKASELKFSVQPQILEDDPIVLWQVEPSISQPVQLSYSVKVAWETTQCIDRGYAADMKNVYKLDPYNFDDCYKYLHIKFLDAVYKNQKRREQEEKDQVKLIQPGEKQYKDIQAKSKEVLKATQVKPSTSKISAEKAVEIVKNQYPKPLMGHEDIGWPAATCSLGDAIFMEAEQRWRVVCIRGQHEVGDIAHNAICEHQWFYFTVDGSGKATEEGWYTKCKLKKDGSISTYGKPLWGIQ